MLRDRILDLFKDYDKDVQEVLPKVFDEEWKRLSLQKPRGISDAIKAIIDAQVGATVDEA